MRLSRRGARRLAATCALLLGAACAGQPTALLPSVTPLPLARAVLPFPVAESTGQSLELAFLGGFNSPRPQLLDVNGDGVLDLFVQEVSGSVTLLEGVKGDGSTPLPRFTLATHRFGDLDVGEWYRFADVDVDGDLDLLTEQPFSYIKLYRNDEGGRGEAPHFVLAADTLRDAAGAPIFADRQNIPQLGDLDCDGRADLLIGRLDGTVARYEATQVAPGVVPRFQLVAPEFEGIRIIGQGQIPGDGGAGAGSRHGANTMALADHDGDGDLDLFWGDFFEPGLLLIENTGSCPAPNFRGTPVQFPPDDPVLTSGYNAPAFGDVDGDGRLDLVLGVLGGAYNPNRTTVENLYYLARPTVGWAVRARRLLPVVDVGSESVPALVDLDADGDLDLLLANKLDPQELTTSRIYWFENVGTPTAPALRLRGALPLGGRGQYHLAPGFGDLDGDGRLDVVLGNWGARLAWYRVTGSGFALVDSALVTITRGSNTMPTLGDLDGDGDLDLIVGEASGWLNYYRNDGTRTAPRFVPVSDEWQGIRVGRRSSPFLVDLDRDGDLDLLVGAEQGELALFRNVGTPPAPRFARDASFAPAVPGLAVPAAGDLDGDGDVEIVVGGVAGGAVYFGRPRS